MAIPATKFHELFEDIKVYLNSRSSPDEFTFKRLERETKKLPDVFESTFVLGFLYCAAKNDALMIEHFEYALALNPNLQVYNNYSICLLDRNLHKKCRKVAYEAFGLFDNASIYQRAFTVAILYGEIEKAEEIIGKLKISSKNRNDKLDSLTELCVENLAELKSAYEITRCTQEQFELLGDIASDILHKYEANVPYIDVTGSGGGLFIHHVKTNNYDMLFDMNYELAEQVTSNSKLKDCELIVKFEISQDYLDDKHAHIKY